MSYDMELRNGTLRYRIRCDECDNRFIDPIDIDGKPWFLDVEQAETRAKRNGWRIRHDFSTGVIHHQCDRHKTLEHIGNARIAEEKE